MAQIANANLTAKEQALGLQLIDRGFQIALVDMLPSVNISGEGYPIRVNWAGVYGATRLEFNAALARVGVALVEESLGDLAFSKSGKSYDITIPPLGEITRRVLSLTFHGMKQGNKSISSTDTLPASHRLVVRTIGSGTVSAPLYAVPHVGARHMIPATLIGANFNNKTLTLPDLQARKIRLSLATGGNPEEFDDQDFTFDRVTGVAAIFPIDLKIVDNVGAELWSVPGELPPTSPIIDVPLEVQFENLLNAALQESKPLDVTFRLKGTSPSKAGFSFSSNGLSIRDFPDAPVQSIELEGDPLALPIDDQFANEQPSKVIADLTVTYKGIRLLEEFSDNLPTGVALKGFVVESEAVARAYPPQAFTQMQFARIGLIGRAPVDCELVVQMVQMVGDRIGSPLSSPGVIQVKASNEVKTQWIELPPDMDLSQGNIGISARANKGRFFWVGDSDSATQIFRPLVKLAIYDRNPGGRALRLNGVQILAVTSEDESHLPAHNFPTSVFRGEPPLFSSSLFLTVDLSDLTLSYAR